MCPFRNGSGPTGQGPGTGRGLGQGGGRGRQPEGFGLGPEGFCICPQCGEKVPHKRAIPCYQVKCSKCGSSMTRER